MSPEIEDPRIREMYTDFYIGKDWQNPPMTSRMKTTEDNVRTLQEYNRNRENRLEKKMNLLIAAVLTLVTAIVLQHFKIV